MIEASGSTSANDRRLLDGYHGQSQPFKFIDDGSDSRSDCTVGWGAVGRGDGSASLRSLVEGDTHMDITAPWALMIGLTCGVIIGMVLMAMLLHPYRKELKRSWQREMQTQQRNTERQQLQQRLRNLDRDRDRGR